MKAFSLFTALVFACTAVSAQQPVPVATPPSPMDNPNAPEITFESEVIDYGTIPYKADGNREFKVTNTGKEPLIISNCQPTCGCTLPTWPKEPIKPGKSAIIKVHYATERVGTFDKTINITSNAKTPFKVIRIKGVVQPDPNAPFAAPLPVSTAPSEITPQK